MESSYMYKDFPIVCGVVTPSYAGLHEEIIHQTLAYVGDDPCIYRPTDTLQMQVWLRPQMQACVRVLF